MLYLLFSSSLWLYVPYTYTRVHTRTHVHTSSSHDDENLIFRSSPPPSSAFLVLPFFLPPSLSPSPSLLPLPPPPRNDIWAKRMNTLRYFVSMVTRWIIRRRVQQRLLVIKARINEVCYDVLRYADRHIKWTPYNTPYYTFY